MPRTASGLPPSLWGQRVLTTQTDARYAHVEVVAEYARDGVLFLGRCNACGGRYERIILVKAGMAAEFGDLDTSRARYDAWRHLHVDCTTRPLVWTMPPPVRAVVDLEIANARRALARSENAGGLVTCFLASGKAAAIGFRINDIEPTSPDAPKDARADEWDRRKAAVRMQVRQRKTEIVAAVAVSEAWMTLGPEVTPDGGVRAALDAHFALPWSDLRRHPSLHPERREALLIVVGTPDFAVGGVAPIVRASGRIEVGPGTIDEPRFNPVDAQSSMLDGLFATPLAEDGHG